MRRYSILAGFLVALIALSPNLVAAQSTPPPAESTVEPAPETGEVNDLTQRERALVRQAVQNTYDSYKRQRTSDGVGNIIGAAVVGGIGGYLYVAGGNQNDPTTQVVGIAVGLSAIPQLINGIWNVFYTTPQEDIAAKLLNDDALLDGAGLVFVEQEARRAKRNRLVGGTTQIASGAALLGSYYLYSQVDLLADSGLLTILLVFSIVGAAVQTIGGVITLVGLSGPERAYRDLLRQMGRSEPGPTRNDNRISRFILAPTLLGDDGKIAPGVGLGFSF